MTRRSIAKSSRSSSSRLPERGYGVRDFSPSRRFVAVAAFVPLAGWLYASTAPGAVSWWSWPVGVIGAAVLSLLVASYWAAPVGARPTLCDLRWPSLGLAGLLLAVGSRAPLGFVVTVFGGTSPSLLNVLQPVVGLASIAVILWALRERLVAEARVLASEDGAVCQTCRPLY